jgi:hypothetical protein
MPYENSAGLGVTNQYGPRATGGAIGLEHGEGSTHVLTVDLTGEMLNSAYAPPVYMPKGALVKKVYLRVDEAFAVSAAGTVAIGGTAPGTDGVVLTEAKLEALGTSDVSSLSIGTWATASATGPLTTQKLAKAITGTVTATQGKGSLIVEYINKTVG